MTFSHVIWDWNGTLLNDAPYSWSVFNVIAQKRGVPEVTFKRYQQLYMHPVEEMYRKAGFNFDNEPFSIITQEWHDLYTESLHALTLFEDTHTAIGFAQNLKITQHVLSALPHPVLENSLRSHGLIPSFASVTGLDDLHGRSKINNAHTLMTELQTSPERVLVIGDSSHDAEVAHAIGARCVLVTCGYEDSERLLKNGYPTADSPLRALKVGLESLSLV